MSGPQTVDAAQSHWLVSGLPESQLQALLDAGRQESYVPGEVIFREGEPSGGLYLTLVGFVSIAATGPRGETLLARIGPNDILGELGVLDGLPRSATALAATLCVLYFVPAEPFLDLLEQSSLACMRLLALLARRLRGTDLRLVELYPATVE